MKKIFLIIIISLIVIFSIVGYKYIKFRDNYAVSDAGFVKSDSLSIINFKVGGKVILLNKKEGDIIKKGELLAKIDDTDFKVLKKEIEKELNSLKEKIASLSIKKERVKNEIDISIKIAKNEINSYKSKLSSLIYQIDSNKVKLEQLKKDIIRHKPLRENNLISKDKYEQLITKAKSLENIIYSQTNEYKSANLKLSNLKERLNLAKNKKLLIKELTKEIKSLQFKKDALAQKLINLNNKILYCNLIAPFDGVIAKKFINNNKVINIGYPVYAVVNPNDLYVEVLLSERKLRGVKEGNEVIIEAEALENKKFKGVVESILPVSASTFSLVPRDIASGEFTKLDQRFVVRIKLLQKDGLRVGMGLNIAIKRK